MTLRKYAIFIALFFTVSTLSLMSIGVFVLSQREFEFGLLLTYLILGIIHGIIALGFAYYNKAIGLVIYLLGFVVGYVILLNGLSQPNEGFLQLASLISAFTITLSAILVGIAVELILWFVQKRKQR